MEYFGNTLTDDVNVLDLTYSDDAPTASAFIVKAVGSV